MKRFLEFLRKDIWRKLIALTIAIVLYLNLYEQKEREIHDVEVEIQHDPEIFIDQSDRHSRVRLTVKGSSRLVQKLDLQGVSGKVKLNDNSAALRSGRARIRLMPENFTCGRGVEIIAIEPQVLQIPVQRQITRNIYIKPDLSGKTAPGKIITSVRCFPEAVTVTGPETTVNSLTDIKTEKFSIKNESIDFSKELKLLNPMNGVLTLSSSNCNISVEIKDSSAVPRKINDVPVRYLFSPLHGKADVALPIPARVTVNIIGAQAAINHISKENITVFADLSDILKPGEYTVPLRANISGAEKNVKLTSITPDSVLVKIKNQTN